MFEESAIEELVSPTELLTGRRETAAKANVDASQLLSENFLSIIHVISQGNAWIISALSPSTGILFSNMPDTNAKDRNWHRDQTVSVTGALGNARYNGDIDNVGEWLQNNLFAAASKSPLACVTGIDVKGLKVAPAKKGAKAKIDRGTASIHLNMLNSVGGIAFGWRIHSTVLDRSGAVVAGKERPRYGWTDDDEKIARETRVRTRKEMEDQAKTAFSHIFPDMSKFPFKTGDKGQFTVTLDTMLKTASSPNGEIVDSKAGEAIIPPAGFKNISDQAKVVFHITVSNVTAADDVDYMRFHMDVASSIQVPMNLLYHITDTDPADGDVKRSLVYMWLGEALKRQFSAMLPKKRRKRGEAAEDDADAVWPIKISDPVAMKKRIEHETKLRGNAAKPRTDSRGWSVTEDGEFMLFPDKTLHGQTLISYSDEVGRLLTALEIEKDRDARATILEKLSEARKGLQGKIVVADWAHDTLVYVNTASNFELRSLRGFSAVTASDEMFVLNMSYTHPRIASDLSSAMRSVVTAVERARRSALEDIDKRLPNATHEAYSIEEKRLDERLPRYNASDISTLGELVKAQEALGGKVTIAHMAGHNYEKFVMPDSVSTKELINQLGRMQRACKAAIEIGLDKVLEDKPDTVRLGMARWLIETIGNTSVDRYVALTQLDQQEKAKTTIGALPDDIIIPNLGPISTLPHQTDVVSVSAKAPRTHFMAVGTGGGKCVTGDTLINTNRGLLRMDELVTHGKGYFSAPDGLLIQGPKGWLPVSKTFRDKSKTIKIKTGNGITVEGTPEHPMLVLTPDLRKVWRRLDNVRPGDVIVSTNDKFIEAKGLQVIPAWAATMLGLLCGNGHIHETDGKLRATLTSDDANLQETFYACFDQAAYACFDQAAAGQPRPQWLKHGAKASTLNLPVWLCEALAAYGLKAATAREKTIPTAIRTDGAETMRLFLDGLFLADSHCDRDEICLIVSNAELANQIRTIMLTVFGILSTIGSKMKYAVLDGVRGQERQYWMLHVAGEHAAKFLDVFPSAKVGVHRRNELRLEPSVMDRSVDLLPHVQEAVLGAFEKARVRGSRPSRFVTETGDEITLSGLKDSFHRPGLIRPINRALFNNVDWAAVLPALARVDSAMQRRVSTIVRNQDRFEIVKTVFKGSVKKDVFDVTVPGAHSFYANGLVSHNTVLAIIDALLLVYKAGVKRVLYMTDAVLTPQLISEINHFSGGKINAVPLTPDIIRRMKADGFLKTSDDVVKWVKSFPPNTLFVAETLAMSSTDAAKKKRSQAGAEEPKQRFVKLFDDEPDAIHYMMAGKVLRQFAEVCLRCEFDAVIIDEAQRIRGLQGNTPTNVGGAARRFLSRANFRRLMTGTPAHNNPEDPVKLTLTAVPVVFGTLQEAVGYYGLRDDKAETTSDGLKRLADQLTEGPMAFTTKTREDWSFALPSMKTSFVTAKLTQRQSTFYEKIMADIMMRFEAGDTQALGDMAEGEAEAVTAEAEQDDGGEGNGEGGEDEIIVGGKKIKEGKLRLMFEPVRQFLVAPDRLVIRNGVKGQRNDYMTTIEDGDVPTGFDLMSPHVENIGRIIVEHLKKPNAGKILVFGQNQCASEHLERWLPKRFPELADKFIRYTAKQKAALDRFRTDDRFRILLADMESMKAGHNLQMVDKIIRIQTPWTPGDVEQSTARMYRPDFSGNRLASNVEQIWSLLETQTGGATIDHMMAARVFQKQLAVSELRYRDRSTIASRQLNDAWEKFATERLPRGEQPFKMSPEMIRSFRKEDSDPFFAARDALDEFENTQSRQRRMLMAINIERATGQSIIDHATGILKGPDAIKVFLEHTMFKLPEGHVLPGSKEVFKAWLPRIQLPDPKKLGLNLPSTEDEALSRLKEKQAVMTEYGPGVISKISKGKVKVKTGVGELNIDPMLIALPSEAGAPELAKMAANMKAHVLTPPGKLPSKMIRDDAEDAEVVEEAPTVVRKGARRKIVNDPPVTPVAGEEEPGEGVKIEAGVIDGMPAFMISDPEVTFVDDIPSTKWHKIGDFLNLSFTNPKALSDFVEAMMESEVLVTDKVRKTALLGQAMTFVKRKTLRASKAPSAPAVTKLWKEVLTTPKPKSGAPNNFPHIMSIGVEVRMIYLLRTLLPSVKAEIVRLVRASGGKVRIESQKNPGFRMALFPTIAAMSKAMQTLKTYAAQADVVLSDAALAESVKMAKDLYTKMSDPTKLVEETEKKVSEERQKAEGKKAPKKAAAKEADEKPAKKAKAKAKAKKEAEAPAKSSKKAAAKKESKKAAAKKATKKTTKKEAVITAPKKAAKAVTKKAAKKAAAKKTAKAKAPPTKAKPKRSAGEARA